MDTINCRVCLSSHVRKYGSTRCLNLGITKNLNPKRELFLCSQCGSIMPNPTPSPKDLLEYYTSYADIDKCYVNSYTWKNRKSYKVISQICSLVGNGSILDIGCADGQLLHMLPSSFKKIGIDISENACRIAEKRGLSIFCTTLKNADITEKFDIILALDLIEHVQNPQETLKIISDLLKPGGYIIIETGNAASLTANILRDDWSYTAVYGHICVFTPSNLSKIAHKVNIKKVMIKKGWHSLPTIKTALFRNFLAYSFRLFRISYRIMRPITHKVKVLKRL